MKAAPSLLLLPLALAACSGGGKAAAPNDSVETVGANSGSDAPSAAVLADLAANARSRAADTAATLAGGEIGKCDFDGWATDSDPAGLNVRAAPSVDAAITGKLPPFLREDVGGLHSGRGPEFSVVEARDGWFRIKDVQVPEIRRGDVEWRPSRVAGWIHGRYLAFALQTEKAFAEPHLASPVVATAWEVDGHYFELDYERPTDCKGKWVKLTVSGRDRKPRIGWVSGICGIQETTCDGELGVSMLDNQTE